MATLWKVGKSVTRAALKASDR